MLKILNASEHPLSPESVSPHACLVVQTLQNAGFQAFIVGGGVRDLMMKLKPKDFDIATDARPEQIRQLFRNSRLIGRRFRIAHVYFHHEILEVSTFRADHSNAQGTEEAHTDKDGIILRDNVFGSFEQDAKRRDFTINALYYDPSHNQLWDPENALKDLQTKQIRLLGEPKDRFTEDPIRVLRAIRFANKLNFQLEKETLNAIPNAIPLLHSIPSGRRFDEYTKLFLHGQAQKNFDSLIKIGALDPLFPGLTANLQDPPFHQLVYQALKNTDERLSEGKHVNPAFLIATFLWKTLQQKKNKIQAETGKFEASAFHQAIRETIQEQIQHTAMPRHFSLGIKEIWAMQPPLERRRPRQIPRLLKHPKFRAAYDFLSMRNGEASVGTELVNWWTKIQTSSPQEQKNMIKLAATLSQTNKKYPRQT